MGSNNYQQNIQRYLQTANSGTLMTNNLSALSVSQYENPITRVKSTIPLKDSITNAASLATNVYDAQSQFQTMLAGNAIVDYYVRLNSIQGKIYEVFITFFISNATGGPVELTPVSQWLSRIELLVGSNPVQVLYKEDLYNYLWVYDLNEFMQVSQLMNLDDRYLPRRDVIANGDLREYILLLPINFIKQAQLIGSGLNQDLNVRLYMSTPVDILVSGVAPTVYATRLQIITNQLLQETLTDAAVKQRIGNYRTKYFWSIRQPENLANVLPSTEYAINLTSFNGMFNQVQFYIIQQNAQGLDAFTQYPVLNWDILDSNGNSVFNNAARQTDDEANYWFGAIVNPLSTFNDNNSLYMMPFSTSVKNDLISGTLNGQYYLDGRFRLIFTTPPIRLPKIITITISALSPAGPGTAGAFRLTYITGIDGINEMTPWLAFGSTAAQIKAAIEALPSFAKYLQTVTVSGDLNSNPTISWDIDGNMAFDEADFNAVFKVDSAVQNGGGATLFYNSPITQQPQNGWWANPGDITVIIQGQQVAALEINKEGAVNVIRC